MRFSTSRRRRAVSGTSGDGVLIRNEISRTPPLTRAGRFCQFRYGIGTSPAVRNNMSSIRHSPADRLHRVRGISAAVRPDKPQRHNLRHPTDPDAIITSGPNGASTMGTVILLIHRIAVIVEEIVTELLAIRPHIGSQVRVIVVHAVINHGHNDFRRLIDGWPLPGCTNVFHPPQVFQQWIVRGGSINPVVQFRA
jgi:hypothetical protein